MGLFRKTDEEKAVRAMGAAHDAMYQRGVRDLAAGVSGTSAEYERLRQTANDAAAKVAQLRAETN